MADDLDYLDSLLDAPFKNDAEVNGKKSSKADEPQIERKKRSRSRDKEKENGSSHKSSKRSRSRSKSRSRSREKRRKDSKKDRKRSKSREREKDRDKNRDERRKSRDRERKRSDRDRSRSKDKEKRRRSRSKDKRRDRDNDDKKRDRKRSRSAEKKRRSYSPRPFRRGRTPPNGLGYRDDSPREDLGPEERDARTIFCMQLSQRTRARDLEEFFSSVGKVRDVRLITCNKTKRFKGISYVEFKDPESVALALGLSGQRLLGIPIVVQHTQAEKNRLANAASPKSPVKTVHQGPMRLYVGSLHFNITEEMLRGIFEPFGKVDNIQLITDPETGRSKGYGFITYHDAEGAKKALEQLNGFELAGRPMKVGNVTERVDIGGHTSLDNEDVDRTGIDLGATGRLQLMFKLAEGAGLAVPQAAANALLAAAPQPTTQPVVEETLQNIAQQSFLLTNMFDPATESTSDWDTEIQDDVIEECNKHGGVLHVHVDTQSSDGKVYVKCPSIATAVLAVNSLRGRWFAGRVVTADFVPLATYHAMFPEAAAAVSLLQTTRTDE